jgi:CRISPR-associated protein Csx14
MAETSIPVDLFNPGQVFACLGFLEAADILMHDAEGGFDWSDGSDVHFRLSAKGDGNPFAMVLEFLAEAEPSRWAPVGYADPPRKKDKGENEDEPGGDGDGSEDAVAVSLELTTTFPAKEADRMALPIRLGGGNRPVVELGHWTDGSSRDSFKLYAGNRSADRIARAMPMGVRKKPTTG